jgi:hypothetical protein
LGDADRQIALVSCDIIALSRRWVDEAKRIVEDRAGVPPERTMVACTHIHTGPCTDSIFGSTRDERYVQELPESIAASISEAQGRMVRSTVSAQVGQEQSLGFNRRYLMEDGSVRTNPGIGNPDIVKAGGPIDPQILALPVRELGGRMVACVFNYGNHVDVLSGSEISPDYPGMLAGLFRERFPGANLIYLNGACGDVNHIDASGPPSQGGMGHSRMMAGRLFGDLLGIMERAGEGSRGGVGGVSREVDLPLRVVSEDQAREARSVVDCSKDGPDAIFAQEVLHLAKNPSRRVRTVVQAIRIGEIALLGLPGEVFAGIGLEIKSRSPFRHTGIAELANDYVGYLPTDRAFEEGGYEVRLARSSRVDKGTEEILVRESLEALHAAGERGKPAT